MSVFFRWASLRQKDIRFGTDQYNRGAHAAKARQPLNIPIMSVAIPVHLRYCENHIEYFLVHFFPVI